MSTRCGIYTGGYHTFSGQWNCTNLFCAVTCVHWLLVYSWEFWQNVEENSWQFMFVSDFSNKLCQNTTIEKYSLLSHVLTACCLGLVVTAAQKYPSPIHDNFILKLTKKFSIWKEKNSCQHWWSRQNIREQQHLSKNSQCVQNATLTKNGKWQLFLY